MSIKNKSMNEIPSNTSSLDEWAMKFLRDKKLLNGRTYLSLQAEGAIKHGGAFVVYLTSDADFPGYEWASQHVGPRWWGRVFHLRLGGWNQGEVNEFTLSPAMVVEEDRRREENWQNLLNQYDWEGLE